MKKRYKILHNTSDNAEFNNNNLGYRTKVYITLSDINNLIKTNFSEEDKNKFGPYTFLPINTNIGLDGSIEIELVAIANLWRMNYGNR